MMFINKLNIHLDHFRQKLSHFEEEMWSTQVSMVFIPLLSQSPWKYLELYRRREILTTRMLKMARATVLHLSTILLDEDKREKSRVARLSRKLAVLRNIVDLAEEEARTSRERIAREVRGMIRVLEVKFEE